MSVARPAATFSRAHLAAWAIALVTSAFALAAIALIAQTPQIPFISEIWGFRGQDVVLAIASLPVGMVIALTRSSHPIGWLLLLASLTYAVEAAADQYAARGHEVGEYSTVATLAAWLPQWIWVTSLVCVVTVILLFPDGRAAGPRWRPFLRAFLVLGVGLTLLLAIAPPLTPAGYPVPDLFGIGPESPLRRLSEVGLLLLAVGFLGGFASLFFRSREAPRCAWLPEAPRGRTAHDLGGIGRPSTTRSGPSSPRDRPGPVSRRVQTARDT